MANISTFLQAIMSARYGKDVRQSIHDGIKAINDEVAADKNEVIASKEAAENAATAASTSAQEASASESAAKKSETAAAASESAASTSAQEASASESAAKKSETAAAASESAASTSAQEASASESAAKKSENAAAASESAAATSAQKASASESAAKKSETAAAASKSAASTSAQTAIDKATLAKSYAVGGTGTRAGEDTDNAKYYMTQAEKQTGGIPTKLSQLENDAGFIAEDGDGSGLTVGFTEAAARENIASGENTGTLMGKIKKWLADLAAAAFMQVITSYADLMAGTALDNYLIGAAAAKEGFTELNGKLHNMLIPLNEQQKNHTINFTDYDVLKIQFKDQSINNALFSREYLRPASKQMMDSICLYNGTAVHELFFTVSFDPALKYVYVSDAYICRVDVIDSTVTSVTAPIIQAVFGMQCVN